MGLEMTPLLELTGARDNMAIPEGISVGDDGDVSLGEQQVLTLLYDGTLRTPPDRSLSDRSLSDRSLSSES